MHARRPGLEPWATTTTERASVTRGSIGCRERWLKPAESEVDIDPVSAVAHPMRRTLDGVLVRVRVAPLALLVTASAAIHFATALARPTPDYFPDEYMYASFARSLAHGHLPVVRGASVQFFPLLQPLLTAPAWLLPSAEAGYRATQAIESVLMSLAAIPVYYLARRLDLPARWALAAAGLSLTIPALVYSSFVVSEPVAYPLALAAIAAAVHAIDRPSPRSFALFLVFAALGMFARLQLAILLPCFAVVLVAVVLRERRFRAFVRANLVTIGLFVVVAGSLLALGPLRNTGYYPSFTSTPEFDPSSAVHLIAPDALVLAFSCGFVLVPGAVLGIGYALARPLQRAEFVFGALTLALTVGLFAQAIVYGHATSAPHRFAADTNYVQERYLFYLLPLWTLAFLLYARRGFPQRGLHAIVAVTLVVFSLRLPLSGYLVGGNIAHSPLLFALRQLADLADSVTTASVVAVQAGALAILALLVVSFLRPRALTAFALVIAGAVTIAATAGAVAFNVRNSQQLHDAVLDGNQSAVDAAETGSATMVLFPGSAQAEQVLFWNSSIDRLAVLPGVVRPDPFAFEQASVARDGTLLVNGVPFRGDALLSTPAAGVGLQNGVVLASTSDSVLAHARAGLRLRYLIDGSTADGWLGGFGTVTVWPTGGRLNGRLVLSIEAPDDGKTLELSFSRTHASTLFRRVGAGRRADVPIQFCSSRPVTVAYRAQPERFVLPDGFVAARLVGARFVPGGC